MLEELASVKKVVGAKQCARALRDARVQRVYFAMDAEQQVLEPILDLCRSQHVPVRPVPAMRDLGQACGLHVGAAVAATLRT